VVSGEKGERYPLFWKRQAMEATFFLQFWEQEEERMGGRDGGTCAVVALVQSRYGATSKGRSLVHLS
jgi:hypothetical protein